LQYVDNHIDRIIEQPRNQILTELKNAEKLPEKRKKEIEIEEELSSKITAAERDDKGLQEIVTKFAELLQQNAFR
jgi:hypothetical protein